VDQCKPLGHGCPMGPGTCTAAAEGGYLNVLRQGLTVVHYSPQRQQFLRNTKEVFSDEVAQVEPKSGRV